MNCDPDCGLNLKRTVRQILENYRKMNGLPTDDFKSDTGEDLMVDVDTTANLIDAVGTDVAEEGIAIYIIDNTENNTISNTDNKEEIINNTITIFILA